MSVDIRHNVSRSSVGTARMSVSRNTFLEPQTSHYKPFYVTGYTPGLLFEIAKQSHTRFIHKLPKLTICPSPSSFIGITPHPMPFT